MRVVPERDKACSLDSYVGVSQTRRPQRKYPSNFLQRHPQRGRNFRAPDVLFRLHRRLFPLSDSQCRCSLNIRPTHRLGVARRLFVFGRRLLLVLHQPRSTLFHRLVTHGEFVFEGAPRACWFQEKPTMTIILGSNPLTTPTFSDPKSLARWSFLVMRSLASAPGSAVWACVQMFLEPPEFVVSPTQNTSFFSGCCQQHLVFHGKYSFFSRGST